MDCFDNLIKNTLLRLSAVLSLLWLKHILIHNNKDRKENKWCAAAVVSLLLFVVLPFVVTTITRPRLHTSDVFSQVNVHKHMQKCSPGLSRLKPLLNSSVVSSFLSSLRCVWKPWLHIARVSARSIWLTGKCEFKLVTSPPHLQSPPFYSVCKLPIRKHKHTYVPPAPLHFKPAETRRLNNKNSQAMKNKRRSAKNWGKSGWRGSLDDKVQKGAFPAFSPPWVHHGRL